ncbi:MAG: OmpA family protein [bacterium]
MKNVIITSSLVLICAAGCASTDNVKAATATAVRTMPTERVHFPTAGRAVLEEDLPKISNNARWLEENPGAIVVIEGHCDERGGREYNMELGDRRARWVMGRLAEEGVEGSRLIVISKGESEPLEPGRGPRALEKNRRVEFVLR